MSNNKTITITSKDISNSKKFKISSILGYKALTMTMTMKTGGQDDELALTKERFHKILRKISRPIRAGD